MDHAMQDQQSKVASATGFSRFVGIDWSGAKTQFIAGIQLAMAGPDTAPPQTIAPPQPVSYTHLTLPTICSG